MSQTTEEPRLVQKYVVVFDICSSTSILEDLLRSESQRRWRDLMIELKDFLRAERKKHGFIIYKFLGDGWILLFEPNFALDGLLSLLCMISMKYGELLGRHILPVLSVEIENHGITYGIDKGTLIRVVMNGLAEYIGRPLNVATRLQVSIKDKDHYPQDKVLMSKTVSAQLSQELRRIYRTKDVTRDLRNISGGSHYKATKLALGGKAEHFEL